MMFEEDDTIDVHPKPRLLDDETEPNPPTGCHWYAMMVFLLCYQMEEYLKLYDFHAHLASSSYSARKSSLTFLRGGHVLNTFRTSLLCDLRN